MPTEQELLQQIRDNMISVQEYRMVVTTLKKQLADAETNLIGFKLKDTQLREQLKQVRNTTYQPEPDPREADDARFLAALPELLEKIK